MEPNEHSAQPVTHAPAPPASRRQYRALVGLLLVIHLGFMAYSFPLDDLLGGRPYAAPDYQTHFHQTTVLSRALKDFGKLWAYDPGTLAGHPIGLIFDVDNKLHFLFSYGVHMLGADLAVGFNLFVLLTCLLAPLSIWLAARCFGLSPPQQLWALGLSILIWNLDSTATAWRGGMISFCMVSHGSIAVLALFWRLTHPEQRRHWPILLALMVLLPLNLLTHVWSFAILVVPLVGLYLWRRRTLGLAGHLRVWGLALFALAANLHWLVPALRHFDLIARSGVVGQANPLYIFTDWFGLLVNPINTGFAIPHTLFRFAALLGAAVTLWRWRRSRDERLFAFALTLGYLVGMAYVAALIPVLRETEPYRFILPGSLLAAVAAAPFWARTVTRAQWRELSPRAKVAAVVLLLLLAPRVAQHVTYFIPELSPEARLPPIVVQRTAAAPTTTVEGRRKDPDWLPQSFRMRGVDDNTIKLAQTIKESCTEPGRVLVQHWAIAEFLGWATGKPMIGGFPDRRLIHEAANIFRRPTDPRFHGEELADYLVRYNIRYLVLTEPVPLLERRRDLFQPHKLVFPHRIYRVRHKATYVARGSAERVEASLNRIRVTGAKPAKGTQALMLRFHHMRSLTCQPGCRVMRSPVPGDAAGFITVVGQPRLPATFTIRNRYR